MTRLGSAIPLVGRAAEFARLTEALSRADGGESGGVVVAGEAGIGKTRLIGALTEHAEAAGAVVLTGRCLDIAEHELPYLAFTDAFAPLAGDDVLAGKPALERLLPQVGEAPRPDRAVLPSVPGAGRSVPERQLGQLQLFDAVLALVADLAAERTVLLVIEDLHWADSSTRDLLSFLLARTRKERVLIVVTYRTDDVHRAHPIRPLLTELARMPSVERVELEPLSEVDSREFIELLAEGPMDRTRVNDIIVRAEGNAFYTEELLASSVDCVNLPDGLADVLLARLERLSGQTQRVVRIASVADGGVTHTALSEVSGVDAAALEESLREAVYHHVLVAEDKYYRFRHALLREAVYGDLLPGERARIHAAYAERLVGKTTPRSAALLAYHSLESNDLPTALASTLRAADEAERRGAPEAALNNVERALRIWDSVDPADRPQETDKTKLLLEAAYFAGLTAHSDRAIGHARALIRLLESPECASMSRQRAAKAWRAVALALDNVSTTEWEAIEAIEKAHDLVIDDGPSRARAWVLATHALLFRGINRFERAAASASIAVEDARALGIAGAEADALCTLARLSERDGRVDEARERYREAFERARDGDSPTAELRAMFSLAMSYVDAAEFSSALEWYRRSDERAKELGLQSSGLGREVRAHLIGLSYVTGQWQAEDPASENGDAPTMDVDRLNGAYVHVLVARGELERAQAVLDDLAQRWRSEFMIALGVGTARCELAQWFGEHQSALDAAVEAIGWLETFESDLIAGVRVAALGIRSAAELARQAREKSDPEAESRAVNAGEQLLVHVRNCVRDGHPRAGELGPEGAAWLLRAEAESSVLWGQSNVELWAQVVDAFGYGAVYEEAIVRWRYAEILLEAQDQEKAAEQLRLSWEAADRLGAKPLADAVQELGRRARVRLGERAAAPASDTFTPRERAVLELVAEGMTNRRIGERLFISEKTVSVHLSRAMAKLGATRRAEAVAVAYDKGLL